MISRLAALVFGLILVAVGPAVGQPVGRIAAVVNDTVISQTDLDARIALVLLGTGLPATEENRASVAPQVLRNLIDEALKRQEAARYNIEVTDDEIAVGITRLAQQNNMTEEQLRDMLQRNHVPISTLEDQARAEIAWGKLTVQRFRAAIQANDEDIDEALAQLESNRGKPEYLLADLFLSVDSAADEAQVRDFAAQLADQIRGGTRFSAVARQFSQSAGASTGGDLGWVMDSQLDPTLAQVVQTMDIGQVSDPIRTLDGYHLILLRDTRRVAEVDPGDAVLDLMQLGLGFPPGMSEAQMNRGVEIARTIANQARSCDAMRAKADDLGVGRGINRGSLRLKDLPSDIRQMVADLPIGQATPPKRVDRGVLVVMICGRQEPQGGPPTREQMAQTISQARLDVQSRRYLRDLRSAAYIDIRTPDAAVAQP